MNTLEQLRSGQLAGAKRLKLASGLTTFPHEIFALADTLEILDLSGNALSTLPDDLPRLRHLRILFCSDNQFTELPDILGQCPRLSMIGFKANQIRHVSGQALPPSLRWLILTDNRIEQLPAEIGRCSPLQKLMLAGNRLSTLPRELAACTRLQLLRIAANRFTELPAWLCTMPRLTWLAYAGNPFCAEAEVIAREETTCAPIPWDQLHLTHTLGEGASGVIHQATYRAQGQTHPVAVKLFKGSVTSDGLPLSEMTACLSSGSHPHLIPVLGKVHQHPKGDPGLVMALIGKQFLPLAGPPSLDACTRDSYAPDLRFEGDSLLRIAFGIASAGRHLHAQGILHGDLYAHNILHDGNGQAVLGDFGAASLIGAGDPRQAEALQRLDVRAFACLLEELLARPASPLPDATHTALIELQVACAHEQPSARPLFAEIESRLAAQIHATTPAGTPSAPPRNWSV